VAIEVANGVYPNGAVDHTEPSTTRSRHAATAHYKRWLERQDVAMRLEYAAGERMFVNFAGDTMPITDRQTGEV
jgi:hypothetical protein